MKCEKNKHKTAACERDGKTITTLSHVVLLYHLVVWFHFSYSCVRSARVFSLYCCCCCCRSSTLLSFRFSFSMCNLFSYCWEVFLVALSFLLSTSPSSSPAAAAAAVRSYMHGPARPSPAHHSTVLALYAIQCSRILVRVHAFMCRWISFGILLQSFYMSLVHFSSLHSFRPMVLAVRFGRLLISPALRTRAWMNYTFWLALPMFFCFVFVCARVCVCV